jgi:cysteine-rich repeat protein
MTEGAETCDDGNTVNTDGCPADCIQDPCTQTQTAAAVLSVNLVSDDADTFGVGTVFLDYPEGLVFIPGTADSADVQGAITNRPTTGSPTCLVNDRDHGLQFGCLSTSGFPEGLIFRAAFRDCDGGTAPTLQDFTCTILEASDTIGFPVTATCSLQLQ